MRISDTTPEVQAKQIRIQRAMSGQQRMLLAFEMTMFARDLTRARIRMDHPNWPESRVTRELLRLALLPDPLPPALR